MTEEEAKDKWCPLSFSAGHAEILPCCASQCALWVKHTSDKAIRDETGNIVRFETKTLDTGHCGVRKI